MSLKIGSVYPDDDLRPAWHHSNYFDYQVFSDHFAKVESTNGTFDLEAWPSDWRCPSALLASSSLDFTHQHSTFCKI